MNAATTSGNIRIESTGSLLLGAVTVQNGRLDLSAYKTITGDEKAQISALRVNLTSTTGRIGTSSTPIKVNLIDSDLQNGDTMSRSLNATATRQQIQARKLRQAKSKVY